MEESTPGTPVKHGQKLLEALTRKKKPVRAARVSPFVPEKVRSVRAGGPSSTAAPTRPISGDDVMDLVIDLETTDSVNDFLERLNRLHPKDRP